MRITFRWVATTILIAVLCLGLAAVGVVVALSAHRAASHSSAVQAHGIRRAGVVTAVDDRAETNEDGDVTGHTSMITVRLDEPAKPGAPADASDTGVTTVVHYPGSAPVGEGAKVTVLIDPGDASYAEIPGKPAGKALQWEVPLLLSVAALLGGVVSSLRRLRRLVG